MYSARISSRISSIAAAALVPALIAASLPAHAQQAAAPAPTAAPVVLPDVVKLKDGSMFRGTVLERVAGDHVDLQLPSGQVRRFADGDVAYAGPASSVPAAAPPLPAPAPAQAAPSDGVKKVRVRLEANAPNIEYELRTGTAHFIGTGWTGGGRSTTVTGTAQAFEALCTAPCDSSLPIGNQPLALSKDGGGPVPIANGVTIAGPSKLEATYTDRSGARVAGLVIGIGGAIVGGAMVGVGMSAGSKLGETEKSLVAGGAAVSIAGFIIGLVLLMQSDTAEIRVVPLTVGAMPQAGRREGQVAPPNGLAIEGRF
jgi:hypothetical protein